MNDEARAKRILFIKAVGAEYLSTTLFMFLSCASSHNFHRQTNQYTYEALIASFQTVFAVIGFVFAFADVSGAHFNPSVTFATFVTGKIDVFKCIFYIFAQLSGSVTAALLTYMVFPGRSIADVVPGRGEDVSLAQMLLMETILSTILMYVIFACAFDKIEDKSEHSSGLTIYKTGGGSKAAFAPIAISFIVGALIFVGGSVSGGCFNPARSFGPAFVTSTWKDHWVYWIANCTGGALGGFLQMIFAHGEVEPLAVVRGLRESFSRKDTRPIVVEEIV